MTPESSQPGQREPSESHPSAGGDGVTPRTRRQARLEREAAEAQRATSESRRRHGLTHRTPHSVHTGSIPAVPAMTVAQAHIPAVAVQNPPEEPAELAFAPLHMPKQGVSAVVSGVDGSAAVSAVGPVPKVSRAGRNLPAAIGVGFGLLALVLFGLLIYPFAFALTTAIASVVAGWEVSRSLKNRGISLPATPFYISMAVIPIAAYAAGAEGLVFAFSLCAAAITIWAALEPAKNVATAAMGAICVVAWVPGLMSFANLMLRSSVEPSELFKWHLAWPGHGALQVIAILFLVFANDIFGYLFGALFGKHPMAPLISPKKSWEGFAGSMLGAIVVGILVSIFLLNEPFWVGLILAIAVMLAATAGDFAESMVKREMGVKDMSNILPGHGGLMDRLDSILFAVPTGYVVLALLETVLGIARIG